MGFTSGFEKTAATNLGLEKEATFVSSMTRFGKMLTPVSMRKRVGTQMRATNLTNKEIRGAIKPPEVNRTHGMTNKQYKSLMDVEQKRYDTQMAGLPKPGSQQYQQVYNQKLNDATFTGNKRVERFDNYKKNMGFSGFARRHPFLTMGGAYLGANMLMGNNQQPPPPPPQIVQY